MYVTNRVTRIRKPTSSEQWHFVSTEKNPEDSLCTTKKHTIWLKGPVFWARETCLQPETFGLIDPDSDTDVAHRFECFSRWKTVCQAIARLIHKVRSFIKNTNTKTAELTQAKTVIIKAAQRDVFPEEIKNLSKGVVVPKSSSLRKLSPLFGLSRWCAENGRMHALF